MLVFAPGTNAGSSRSLSGSGEGSSGVEGPLSRRSIRCPSVGSLVVRALPPPRPGDLELERCATPSEPEC